MLASRSATTAGTVRGAPAGSSAAGLLHGDAATASPQAFTSARAQLARQVDEIVSRRPARRGTRRRDPRRAPCPATTGRRAHRAALRARCPASVHFDLLPADARARRFDGGRVGHAIARRIRTEPPQIHQRPDGEVVGAATGFGQAQAVAHHRRELGIDVQPLAAVVFVETAQRRVRPIGAQCLVDGLEARLHAGAQVLAGRGQRARDPHRPGAAHGFAAQHGLVGKGRRRILRERQDRRQQRRATNYCGRTSSVSVVGRGAFLHAGHGGVLVLDLGIEPVEPGAPAR